MSGRSIAALIAVALVILFGLLGGGGMMGYGSGMMGGGGYGGSGFGGPGFTGLGIVMMLFWALVIGGVVWLIASFLNPSRRTTTNPGISSTQPLDILKERYARSEITREEYDRMREDLER